MAFLFKLETRDRLPAKPPTLSAAVPNWSPGRDPARPWARAPNRVSREPDLLGKGDLG
jgi:hypothetical protein